MSSSSVSVSSSLLELEHVLQALNLWDAESPSAQALASTQPFCIDTLELNQWLQWIFIPKMRDLIAAHASLPHACGIAPLLEEWVKGKAGDFSPLFAVLTQLDESLNEQTRG